MIKRVDCEVGIILVERYLRLRRSRKVGKYEILILAILEPNLMGVELLGRHKYKDTGGVKQTRENYLNYEFFDE